jgi:hypothetical protein
VADCARRLSSRGNPLQRCARTFFAARSLGCQRSANVQARSCPASAISIDENDARLLTPLLLMALVIAAGVLFYALTGYALAAA